MEFEYCLRKQTNTNISKPLDDRGKPSPPPLSKTPELSKGDSVPTETTSSDMNTKPPILSEAKVPSCLDIIATTVPSVSADADVMNAPLPPLEAPQSAPEVPAYPAPLPDPLRTSAVAEKTSKSEAAETTAEASKEEDSKTEEPVVSSDAPMEPPSTTNGMAEVDAEAERLSVALPSSQSEAALESPIAQPEELRLPNGLPLPAPQDPDVPVANTAERDDSPIAEPVVAQQAASQEPPAATQAAPIETAPVETTPVDINSPSSAVQAVSADPVVQEMPVQPEQPDSVSTVAEEKEIETLAPPPVAKEEKPLPAEATPVSDNASETVPTPPPTAAEEREDTPNPQTVTATPVETTMQGQFNPRYHTQGTDKFLCLFLVTRGTW